MHSSPAGPHAGGGTGIWHVWNRSRTEIIVLAYVSQHEAVRRAPSRQRAIAGVQGLSGRSRESSAGSRNSDRFSGSKALPRWLG